MDKETLSNYGWVVICVLVLVVMIALATPFGNYVATAVKNTTIALTDSAQDKANDAGNILEFDNPVFDFDGENATDNTAEYSATFADNSWETIQQVARAGKAQEAGWNVGDSKQLSINGVECEAVIIGFNHDAPNSITLMVMESIGTYKMSQSDTPPGSNFGGWESCKVREWLNGEVYNSVEDLEGNSIKEYIKEVTKYSNNVGQNGTVATATSDYLFLLSAAETNHLHTNVLADEGAVYQWFIDNPDVFPVKTWLRSAATSSSVAFWSLFPSSATEIAKINTNSAGSTQNVCPAFVIG